MSPLPDLEQCLHVSIEYGEQAVLRATAFAVSRAGIVHAHGGFLFNFGAIAHFTPAHRIGEVESRQLKRCMIHQLAMLLANRYPFTCVWVHTSLTGMVKTNQ